MTTADSVTCLFNSLGVCASQHQEARAERAYSPCRRQVRKTCLKGQRRRKVWKGWRKTRKVRKGRRKGLVWQRKRKGRQGRQEPSWHDHVSTRSVPRVLGSLLGVGTQTCPLSAVMSNASVGPRRLRAATAARMSRQRFLYVSNGYTSLMMMKKKK
eukprot:1256528-Amphidinium_carterae.1